MTWTVVDSLAIATAARRQPAVAARQLADAGFPAGDWTMEQVLDVLRLPVLDASRLRQEATHWLTRAAAQGHTVCAIGCSGYPGVLRSLPDPPLALWICGESALLDGPAIAIVGSRAARPAALEVAYGLAVDLARCGLTIVSGLALGVDGAAHRGALQTGRTVAVLGTGLDVSYPRQHAALRAEVAAAGALVTEFFPGEAPRAHHFPLRNRILSGLTLGVVVVEASERSGSLITARLALEQGRAVMVVPGDVRGGSNRGGHALLRDGARLVECAADVLEELGLVVSGPPGKAGAPPAVAPLAAPAMPPLLRVIVASGGLHLDELASRMAQAPAVLLQDLLDFELAGLIARDATGRFLPVQRKW
jgi:DNA processing protein